MSGIYNGVVDIDYRGPKRLVWCVVYKDEMVYNADQKIDKLTDEIRAYMVSVDGPFELEPIK